MHPEANEPTNDPALTETGNDTELPPELADFLGDVELGCLFHATDHGTAMVLKAPAHEIDSLRGSYPIRLRYELFSHPASPVIRTTITFFDRPAAPLSLETFINISDGDQRAEFAALADQERMLLLFYDEALGHRLTKQIAINDPDVVRQVVRTADDLLAAIPPVSVDFDRAKQAVVEATHL